MVNDTGDVSGGRTRGDEAGYLCIIHLPDTMGKGGLEGFPEWTVVGGGRQNCQKRRRDREAASALNTITRVSDGSVITTAGNIISTW